MRNTLSGIVYSTLTIDDSRFTLLTQSMLLKRLGHHVFTAENSKCALKILSKQHVDLILMDIQMPDVRGDELAYQIHKLFPVVPIVAVTTARWEELGLRADAGFKAILKKPLTGIMIREIMRTCFQLT